ncbi:MAG: PAS-domain containing protein [Rhodocyclaceae bacterium]|nr:PAS-domain containing protein [Rhodocyclaceae bacterium]
MQALLLTTIAALAVAVCGLVLLLLRLRSRLADARQRLRSAPAPRLPSTGQRPPSEILQSIFDNLPGGVTLFDAELAMVACNRQLIELLDFPPSLFEGGRLPSFETLVRFNIGRGEYGPGDPEAQVAGLLERARSGQPHCFERTRPDGTVLEIRGAPLPDGGFISIYTDITRRRSTEQALERRSAYLQAVLDQMPHGVSVFDENLRLRHWNATFIEVLDLPLEAVYEYVPFEDLIRIPAERGEYGPGDIQQHVERRRELAARFEAHRVERRRPNGRTHLIEGQPLSLDGRVAGFITTYTDITDRIEVETELRTRNEIFRTLIDNIPGGVTLFDGRFRLVACNEAYRQLLDFPPELFDNGPTLERFFRYNAQRGEYGECQIEDKVRELMDRARQRQPHVFERTRPNGTVLEIRGLPLPDGGFVTIYTDVTEHKRAIEAVEELAHRDALTGLANRYTLEARLDQAIAEARRNGTKLALMFIDMDNFKSINDSLGHDIGDQYLKEIASRLDDCVRDSDIVARLGGDEFVLALTELSSPALAAPLAANVLETLSEPTSLGGHTIVPSASVGISVFPDDGKDRGDLMKHSDVAMYSAKKAGRNAYRFYDPAMTEAAEERLRFEGTMRQALAHEEYILHFQPKVEAASLRTVGVEALLRWQRPDGWLVPPMRFIPLAEETGLIEPIGTWVLRKACETLQAWRRAGVLEISMAINLSARQLRSSAFVDQVADTLRDTGLPPQLLELEVTESVAMEDAEMSVRRLRALKALGVRLSIDDFGTGYSSLAYLKLLPIDQLKLDRTFVKDIESDPNDAAICAATIGLAHSMGLAVVAEGVETQAQADYLGRLQCDTMQGYLFSRPLPEHQALAFVHGTEGRLRPRS